MKFATIEVKTNDRQIIPESLVAFLRKHTALDSYQANFNYSFAELDFFSDAPRWYIASAFEWSETLETWSFWARLEDLWLRWLRDSHRPLPDLTAVTDSVHRKNIEERAEREEQRRDYLTEISK